MRISPADFLCDYLRSEGVVNGFELVDLPGEIVRFVRLPLLHDATSDANDVLHFGLDIREGFIEFLANESIKPVRTGALPYDWSAYQALL